MKILEDQYEQAYQLIVESASRETGCSVVILVASDVDSICCMSILTVFSVPGEFFFLLTL